MRVLLDTNILISAMVFHSSKMAEVLRKTVVEHELCLAAYTVEETKRILNEKFTNVEVDIDRFFQDYPYTLICSSFDDGPSLVEIRDKNDYPIIYAAIVDQIDILVTGDKDFFDVKVDRPLIVTPADFLANY